MEELAIGIDLGTTYCCIAVYRNGDLEVIPNEIGKNTTPSYIHVDDSDFVTVGQTPKGIALQDPSRAVYDVKRLIGRRFNDATVQKDMKIWPFKLIEDEDTHISKILLNKKSYLPEQISAHVLKHLKKCAEEYLNCSVKRAVITVPAYFNESQRHATKIAGAMAGMEVLKLLNEPTAAALTYCYKNNSFKDERTVLVFDLGGGTFDVVVMAIKDRNIVIKAIGGDSHLGGQDIDRNLVEHCLQEFKTKNGIDLTSVESDRDEVKVARLLRRLKNECEEIKTQLSNAKRSVISLSAVRGDTDLVVKITREKFESLNDNLFQECINIVKAVVKDAKLTTSDFDEVIMVGGSSRIPKLQEMLMEIFPGKRPNKTIQADEAIARGAAIQAALLTTDCTALKDIFPQVNIREITVSPPIEIVNAPSTEAKADQANSSNNARPPPLPPKKHRPITKAEDVRPVDKLPGKAVISNKSLPFINLGIYLDETNIYVGTTHLETILPKIVIQHPSRLTFLEDKLVIGTKIETNDVCYKFYLYKLLKDDRNSKYKIQFGSIDANLSPEQILSIFFNQLLQDIKRKIKSAKIGYVIISTAFVLTSYEKQRLGYSLTSGGIIPTRILSSLLTTAIAEATYHRFHNSAVIKNFNEFVVIAHLLNHSFSMAVVEIGKDYISMRSCVGSDNYDQVFDRKNANNNLVQLALMDCSQDFGDCKRILEVTASSIPSPFWKDSAGENDLKITTIGAFKGPFAGACFLACSNNLPQLKHPVVNHIHDVSRSDLVIQISDAHNRRQLSFKNTEFIPRIVFQHKVSVPDEQEITIDFWEKLTEDSAAEIGKFRIDGAKWHETLIQVHVNQDGIFSLKAADANVRNLNEFQGSLPGQPDEAKDIWNYYGIENFTDLKTLEHKSISPEEITQISHVENNLASGTETKISLQPSKPKVKASGEYSFIKRLMGKK